MKDIPGLVTCGDADTARYIISRNFVERSRRKGINIIWKSFPNHPHDVPPDSLKLARAFLTYYHELYKEDLDFHACFSTVVSKLGSSLSVDNTTRLRFKMIVITSSTTPSTF